MEVKIKSQFDLIKKKKLESNSVFEQIETVLNFEFGMKMKFVVTFLLRSDLLFMTSS